MIEKYLDEKEQIVSWNNKKLQYCGRMDFDCEDGPLWVYPCSYVKIHFRGTCIKTVVTNYHAYWKNSLGYLIDGVEYRIDLPEEGTVCLTLASNLTNEEHEVCLFKRMDSCHMITFHGFIIEESAMVMDLAEKSTRNIEVYGDSVSAGEVSEAIDYCGQPDPEHNGEYSNSYYSYAWFLSRKLNANLHNIAQGGIALLDNTGYFMEPKALGIPAIFDKIQYQPVLCKPKEWDFKQYTPQVVIVAIGQNDSHPIDFMAIDHNSEQARVWKKSYEEFLNKLREIYPHSHIICKTTILEHNISWDLAIEDIVKQKKDEKVHYFKYSNNSMGTKGHIRKPEAENMAQELATFIQKLDDKWNIW